MENTIDKYKIKDKDDEYKYKQNNGITYLHFLYYKYSDTGNIHFEYNNIIDPKDNIDFNDLLKILCIINNLPENINENLFFYIWCLSCAIFKTKI